MQTSLTFPKSSELQLDTEDELSVDPGILFSSELRAIAGDLSVCTIRQKTSA
jgi:hypothetical protein